MITVVWTGWTEKFLISMDTGMVEDVDTLALGIVGV
jgi:hypothetical protein